MPTRKITSVRKLGTPGVSQAAEAALRGVWETTHLPTTSVGAKNVRPGTCTPRPPTPSVPLTKLLNRRGLTGAQLLLTLAATKAATLRGRTATSTTFSATSSATATTASTAATDAPTPGTTPTTTSTSSTSSTAASTAPSTTPASLALASAASPTRGSRRRADLLSANEVDSSSRGNREEKGDRGTPLKEGGATVAARSTDS
ncbi:unnamed protein product [Closterium sp. NIES-53]